MRAMLVVLCAAIALPAELESQAQPAPEVLGRNVTLQLTGGAPGALGGELLAAGADSAWVLALHPRRVVAVPMSAVSVATVRRHGLTAGKGLLWGVAVGVLSGAGLTAACSQVSSGCGGVMVGSVLSGLLWGGLSAISFAYSERWRIEPVAADSIARFARFPQGPPVGLRLDDLARPEGDSMPARPRP
ncbi:MAG: hypothetical protein ABSG61_03395 [Gemmatimonadales bacterium]|jgi:hypothetical protein